METTVDSLQKLIEKRAEKRLDNDLQALSNYIRNNKLIGHYLSDPTYPVVKTQRLIEGGPDKEWTTRSLSELFNPDYETIKQLKAFWLPAYIQRDAEAFIKKVDNLSEQIEELKNFSDE